MSAQFSVQEILNRVFDVSAGRLSAATNGDGEGVAQRQSQEILNLVFDETNGVLLLN